MPPNTNRGAYSQLGLSSDVLLTAVPEPVYVVDINGRFVQWSDEFTTVTGYDDETLASSTWDDLVMNSDSQLAARHLKRIRDGSTSTYYGRLQTADGDLRRHECTERPLVDDDGTVVGRLGVAKPVEEASQTAQFESFVDEVTDYAIFLLTPDGGVVTWNDGARRLTGYREHEIVGQHFSVFYTDENAVTGAPESVLERARANGRAESEGWRVRKDGSRFWAAVTITAIHDDSGHLRGFTIVVRDLTYHHEQDELVRRQRDELDAINRLNQLVQTLIQGIVTKSSQDAMEQLICDELAHFDLYHSAYVGDVDSDKTAMSIRASAGEDAALEVLLEAAQPYEFTAQIAEMVREGESVVLPNLETDLDVPEELRAAAAEQSVGACIMVPLRFGEMVYGTLVVYAENKTVFGERERAAFDLLGETMGFAINALRNRQLLFADTVVELEFQTADREAFFSGLSYKHGCRCVLEGQVLTEDDRTLQYVRVIGMPPERVYELAVEHGTLDEVRLISDEGDECLLEVVNIASGVQALVEAGAYVQSGVAENGVVTIRTEVAKGEDIRSIAKAFRRIYPDATLASKHEVERPTRTAQSFRRELDSRLTKRQKTALRTAHLAGYFEWPRGSTAEEVAAAMDITSATLHYHLRRAQYELIDTYLDGESI